MSPKLIYIAGPTGVGKTSLSITLAKHYNTEIVSCDSRQFYKEMRIGTAIPTEDELSQVPHHLIHHQSIKHPISVGADEKQALTVLDKLFKKHENVILTGGSGLYAQALLEGLDVFPEVPEDVKAQLGVFYKTHGLQGLQDLLRDQDPTHYQKVDRQNPVRLLRALEICFTSGVPYSSFLGKNKKSRPFESQIVVLHQPREILYERINIRVDQMIEEGLEEEVKNLEACREMSSMKTVGYQEWWNYFDGVYNRDKVISEIKKNTRRYAKRQITWFKRYGENVVLPANTPLKELIDYLED